MEEIRDSFVGTPDTEASKQEYHNGNKKKNKKYYNGDADVAKVTLDDEAEMKEAVKKVEGKAEEKVEEGKTPETVSIEAKVEDAFVPLVEPKHEMIKPEKKNKGKVIMVGKATISVLDKDGHAITIRGHRDNVKVGDTIEY